MKERRLDKEVQEEGSGMGNGEVVEEESVVA